MKLHHWVTVPVSPPTEGPHGSGSLSSVRELCPKFSLHQSLCLVTVLCPALCDPMDCRTLGSFVLHYLSELAQIRVH